MTKTTYGFSTDGTLTLIGPLTVSNASIYPMPPMPSSLLALHEAMERLRATDLLPPAPDMRVHPDHMPGLRSALGIDQQMAQAQHRLNRVHNSILDALRITIDPYVPRTVHRQFRFPRSKKARIRKKWAKNPRNWRDERVLFLFTAPPELIRYPSGRTGFSTPKSAAMLHNFSI